MRAKIIAFVLALGLCLGGTALAQPGPAGQTVVAPAGSGEPANQRVTPNDPIGDALIPPDVIMSHQGELGLTDQQRKSIESDVTRAQQRFIQIQWQLSAAIEKLASTLSQPRVDQSKAMAQLDVELQLEREAKRTQLGMMIQVKNELTPDQQAKAFALQRVQPH